MSPSSAPTKTSKLGLSTTFGHNQSSPARVALALIAVLVALPVPGVAREKYQDRIPNGKKVSIDDGSAWPGVGHMRAQGGGSLNPFGEDFKSAGYQWTEDLCNKDSDGDGLTNGVELGDPYCEWQVGDSPLFEAGISHPGFASTVRSSFSYCDTYDEPNGTLSFNATMPGYTVPSKETTYAKYLLDNIPSGITYVTRIAPIIDQRDVVHHMLLYDCVDNDEVRSAFTTPGEAGTMAGCANLVFAWAVGGNEFCLPEDVGFRLNGTGHVLVLEIHYDDPQTQADLVDASGLQLYYSLAANVDSSFQAAAWAWMGAAFSEISIPAGQTYYEISATGIMPNVLGSGGINVFAVLEHGHKIATKIWTTVTPASTAKEAYLASCNSNYDFDLQETKSIEDQLNFNVGDRITVHCVYNSESRSSTTSGGDATSDEMCMGLFMYYPASSVELRALVHDVTLSTTPLALEYDASLTCGTAAQTSATSFGEWISGAPWQLAFHAMLMFVAWIFIFPAATMLPLFFKTKGGKIWFWGHEILVVSALTMVFIAFIVIVTYKKGSNFNSSHGQLGLSILLLVVLHCILAMLRPEHEAPHRKTWELVHHSIGRIVIILALVNVILGIKRLEEYYIPSDAAVPFMIVCIVIIALFAIATLAFMCCKSKQKKLTVNSESL
mmetsp:Transcript_7073/g.14214  ORF Transcript_7073/g.14214 Transcript_7073/m.14214 type:complete len:665 (-) Transcript_7073:87-2081(-)|eukprot:CAMPEP_0171526924 /NCGR_PEP_ID=MMETSP0959-20130129/10715_1 /TAXON_ID=87120 /ORGANISM="Aurantiochytrium limacinum, Strain ATCCMYA-1381" /LENGTH=664 /DNA_ID=CAMNT_0012068505 /DNA_START=156 /DNA_END=2150 /DNA_ORIENTATION=+